MDKIHSKLREEYERTIKQINNNEVNGSSLISFDEVLRAHFLIADYFIQEDENLICGVKNLSSLGSTLGRQVTGFEGHEKYKHPIEKCSTLFFGLIKNHPFHDGNKRTALLTLIYHLNKIGRTIDVPQKEFENLAVNIAANNLTTYPMYKKNYDKTDDGIVNFITDFIRKKTRTIDRRYYQVTYKEFNTLLNRFDVYLENHSSNYIDVVKYETKKTFFGGAKQERKKIMQIGFPGWKNKINMKAAKEVLKATRLTADNGIDSKVFYQGSSPLASLIDEFRGPLMRLKDK